MMRQLTIEPYEIITITNCVWSRSFSRPVSNKKEIAERSRYPLNRVLLLDAGLRTTKIEQEQEEKTTSDLILTQSTLPILNTTPPTTPTYDPTLLAVPPSNTPRDPLNFPQGTAA